MAAHLLSRIQQDLQLLHGCAVADHALLSGLQATTRPQVQAYLRQHGKMQDRR